MGSGMHRPDDALLGGWAGLAQWRVLDVGSDSGERFLAARAAWRADPRRPRLLHWLACRAAPLDPAELLRAVPQDSPLQPLAQALAALAPMAAQRGGRLWCVFGCGGNRDPGKRPLMGAVAQKGADRVLVTSDNPRGEAPADIIHQILAGTIASTQVRAEADRAVAIAQAIAEADARDVLLIAGKGHEDYQETAGVRRPFSDLEHARAALARRPAA